MILRMLLASTILFSGTQLGYGQQRISIVVPPNGLYWEIEMYGAANLTEEWPLNLYRVLPDGSQELVGVCGAPVTSPSGYYSYCMTTNRFTGPIELLVDPERPTGWAMVVKIFKAPYQNYLPWLQSGDQTVQSQIGYP